MKFRIFEYNGIPLRFPVLENYRLFGVTRRMNAIAWDRFMRAKRNHEFNAVFDDSSRLFAWRFYKVPTAFPPDGVISDREAFLSKTGVWAVRVQYFTPAFNCDWNRRDLEFIFLKRNLEDDFRSFLKDTNITGYVEELEYDPFSTSPLVVTEDF